MALDAVTLIENLASGIFTAGLDLLFSWSEMIGFGLIALLTRQRSSRSPLSPGKFAIGLFPAPRWYLSPPSLMPVVRSLALAPHLLMQSRMCNPPPMALLPGLLTPYFLWFG